MNEKKRPELVNNIGKIPPSSTDLECAFLGALLIEPEQCKSLFDICKPEWFYDSNNATIFSVMLELHDKDEPIDIIIVKDRLATKHKLDEIGGAVYLSKLTGKIASSAHASFHMRIIQQKYILRETIRMCAETENICFNDEIDLDDMIHDHIDGISGLLAYTKRKEMSEIDKVLDMTAEEINDNCANENNYYSTNSPKFDAIVSLAKRMIVLFAGDKGSARKNLIFYTCIDVPLFFNYYICRN